MSSASTTARPSGAAHGTAQTPSSWNASDSPCAAMNPATHSARSAEPSVPSSFARSARDTAPGPPGLRCRGRPEQRPGPGRVPLPHRRPAPRRVQFALPVVRHGQRHDLLRRTPAEPPGPGGERGRLHQLAEPPGPFAPARRRPSATTPSRSMPASHSCGASTAIAAPVAVPLWSTATHDAARAAIRPASAEPGSADSNSAAVARTLRLRSANACSRNGSSASHSPVRSESRNISRSSARSVAQVVASSSRAAAASCARIAARSATRSANRPSCHSRWSALVLRRRAARLRRPVSHAARTSSPRSAGPATGRADPAKVSAAGRRSVRPRAASSSAGSSCGGAANPRSFAGASHWGSSSIRSGAVPLRPPPPGAGPVGEQHRQPARGAGGGSAGRGSCSGRLRPCRRPARAAARPAAVRSPRRRVQQGDRAPPARTRSPAAYAARSRAAPRSRAPPRSSRWGRPGE